MASYVVMQRGSGRHAETVLVRDGFSPVALVVPLLWLLRFRLWFAALMLVLVSIAIGLAGTLFNAGPQMPVAGLAIAFFVALEGPAWRIARLRRRGFDERGAIVAPDLGEAEIRWFASRPSPRRSNSVTGVPMKDNAAAPVAEPPTDMLFGFAGGEAR